MAGKLKTRVFDVAACIARIRSELTSRGVPLDRDEGIPLAQMFVKRARAQLGNDVVLENMFAHPLWVHVASVHDPNRQRHVPECEECALLYALWLPYLAEHDQRDRIRRELTKARSTARQGMAQIREVLKSHPTLHRELELYDQLDDRLAFITSVRSSGAASAPPSPTTPRGRRPLSLVREVEATLKRAGLTDAHVAKLVFGSDDHTTIRSLRDRRRPPRAKAR